MRPTIALAPFIAACTKFIFLENPKPIKPASGKQSTKTKAEPGLQTKQNLKANTKLINTLRNAVSASADEDGWANLSMIANRINNEGPFDHRSYGFKKLVDLYEAIDLFEVRRAKSASNTTISVRIAKVGGKRVKPKVIEPDWDSEVDPDDIPF